MKIWIYRPDKALPDLDPSLLYYKGKTAEELENPKKKTIKKPRFTQYPEHYVEVPND